MKLIFGYLCAFIWLFHLLMGVGAFYSALRLWPAREHPMIWRLGVYLNGFLFEVLTAIILVFVSKGVVFTWTFSAVMFLGTFLGDAVRAPLIVYLMKGPKDMPESATSGQMPPEFWRKEFRQAVRDETLAMKAEGLL